MMLNINIKKENIRYKILFIEDSNLLLNTIQNNIQNFQTKQILYVIDSNFFDLYKETIQNLKTNNSLIQILASGEPNKTLNTAMSIVDTLMKNKFSRGDYLIALGGGVTGDIVGFAGSIFKRGINLIQIPTTLISVFDSSVGGKTGVNYGDIKNGIGAFYNPNLVIINPKYLKTLEEVDIVGGYFEGLKHSILSSKSDYLEFKSTFDSFITKQFPKNIGEIIKKNIEFKINVVQKDPEEKLGLRKILNYGHSFGHALETISNFQIGHGIGVGYGIIYANILSHKLGLLSTNTKDEINGFARESLKKYPLKNLNFEKLYNIILSDKKNTGTKITFLLLKDFGKTQTLEIEDKKILEDSFHDFISFIN